MADWFKIKSRGSVLDRRGLGPAAGGGIGIVGIGIILLVTLLGGGDVSDVLPEIIEQAAVAPQSAVDPAQFAGEDEYEVFVSTVLGSVNDAWESAFASANATYEEPTLVLFRGSTTSSCGGAFSQSGPHYCPADATIYLDETFFEELRRRFGGSTGDVAQAYVIAHEVGHHVQNITGTLDSSASSIAIELQADCYAGLWAYSIKDAGVFEAGEIQEALDAAAAVGDDNIQKRTTGTVHPESWTHGSSEARVGAFMRGFEEGRVDACALR